MCNTKRTWIFFFTSFLFPFCCFLCRLFLLLSHLLFHLSLSCHPFIIYSPLVFRLSRSFSFHSFSSFTPLLSPLPFFFSAAFLLLFLSFIPLDFISSSVLSVVFLTSFSLLFYPSFFSILFSSLSSMCSVVLLQRESHFINNRCWLTQHRLLVIC